MKRPMRIVLSLLCIAGSFAVARAGDVQVSKMALMTFDGNVRIAASADKVWHELTDADKAMSWCPLWKNAEHAESLTKLGASIDFLDEWENPGRSVVIYVDPGKELRLAHVPNDGSYVCQLKVVLTPDGDATNVHATEQYSDALDAPVDKDTAAQMQTEMGKYLKELKNLAESS